MLGSQISLSQDCGELRLADTLLRAVENSGHHQRRTSPSTEQTKTRLQGLPPTEDLLQNGNQ